MASPANVPVLVEVAVDSVEGAIAAAAAGAARIELCNALLEGGLTPSLGLMAAVRDAVTIPVFAMVRPRGGDFLYSDAEFDVLERDARLLRDAGADGLVTGVLTPDGAIDASRFERLRKLARELPITCHRAFDLCADAGSALATLRALGIERVLTSGQEASAAAGVDAIARLVATAEDDIVVMAGAGIRAANAAAIVRHTGCREIHLSATKWRDSAMTFRRDGVPMGVAAQPAEYALRTTDGDMVAAVVAAAG